MRESCRSSMVRILFNQSECKVLGWANQKPWKQPAAAGFGGKVPLRSCSVDNSLLVMIVLFDYLQCTYSFYLE